MGTRSATVVPFPSRLTSALDLASHGLRVFPLSPNSKYPPKDFAWKEKATVDQAAIERWWRGNPDFNIGVATGGGRIVVDADCKKGAKGLDSLEELDCALGLPTSYRVATPSGGMHVYLASPGQHDNRVNSLNGYPGIDIRAEAGYVVGPGSVTPEGAYTAVGNPAAIAAAPAWFETILADTPQRRMQRSDAPLVELDRPENIARLVEYLTDFAPEAVEGAGGDMVTYQVACRCRDYAVSEGVALEQMLDHWNEQKASPPWMPDELQAKVEHAYRYATGGWGAALAAAEFDVVDLGEAEGVVGGKAPAGGYFLSYADMVALPEPTWLVDGVLQRGTAALMFGKSNTFKSFLAIDLALCVATGRRWHGRDVQKGRVAIVATEGAVGVGRQRVPGWFDYHGTEHGHRFDVHLHRTEIAIDDKRAVSRLIAEIEAIGGLDLIVLDIFGGTMNGSEVEDTTARAWVQGIQRLLRATGATILTVAHTGWQDQTRARMHTHFWGSFDTRLRVEGDKEKRTSLLTVERHKDADSTGRWPFRLEAECGTLVPLLDASAVSGPVYKLSPAQGTALRALEVAVSNHGETRSGPGWPAQHVVSITHWRDAAISLGITTSTTSANIRRTFNRAMQDLEELTAVFIRDDYAWANEAV